MNTLHHLQLVGQNSSPMLHSGSEAELMSQCLLSRKFFKYLEKFYGLRFESKLTTLELMELAQRETERLAITAVSMLDLDRNSLKEMMGDAEWQFIDTCHHYLLNRHPEHAA